MCMFVYVCARICMCMYVCMSVCVYRTAHIRIFVPACVLYGDEIFLRPSWDICCKPRRLHLQKEPALISSLVAIQHRNCMGSLRAPFRMF